ncbi:hypothetical protein [Chamaesiphon minutus]|uniref:Uncharacterized protein n=1 Tax=Chamaesiphon minutus (strain ATCC 27169 / PCC 6605) TaxID=1173020 RepID=K9UH87_CHAP6|nr:hypothetical protein [Chamaesiphon minutus]AFY93791.1 hypothetical protein Cha6605_2752 [Chamaesiphon minutus PCC 6605]
MTSPIDPDLPTTSQDRQDSVSNRDENRTEPQPAEPILCPHCLRTASNGIKCKGICVSDSDY